MRKEPQVYPEQLEPMGLLDCKDPQELQVFRGPLEQLEIKELQEIKD